MRQFNIGFRCDSVFDIFVLTHDYTVNLSGRQYSILELLINGHGEKTSWNLESVGRKAA